MEYIESLDRPALSVVTCAEVMRGCRDLTKQKALEETWSTFRLIDVDGMIAQVAGQLALRHFPQKKKKILFDCLIAASAQVFGLSLATRNVKDYQKMFPGLKAPYVLNKL